MKYSLISIVIILAIFSINQVYAIEWKNYTSEKYGISLQVPETWTIKEKENRFEDPNSVILETRNPNNSTQWLGIQNIPVMERTVSERGLYKTTSIMMNVALNNPDNVLVEDVDTTTYKIDGYETGSFLVANNNFIDKSFMLQDNDGDGFIIRYQNSPDQFDSPQSQEILDHMIKSIKFLD